MPTIRKIVSAVQAFVDKLNSMDDSTRETILKVAALAAAIGPLLIVLGKTISTAGTALKGFSSLAKGIRLLSTRVGSASGLFGKLGAALGASLHRLWQWLRHWYTGRCFYAPLEYQ